MDAIASSPRFATRPRNCARHFRVTTRQVESSRKTRPQRGSRRARSIACVRRIAPSLRRAINATGVILHTNLGRAPLALEALGARGKHRVGYSTLEYDVDAGRRGHRHVHAERLLCDLTGAEAALVVNNNAAAVLLVLAALAAGREVIVSRGELVEIGGGFRVPDVLRAVGRDAARGRHDESHASQRLRGSNSAIGPRCAARAPLELPRGRFHRAAGARPSCRRLARPLQHSACRRSRERLARRRGRSPALRDEPSVRASLAAGADLVAFSGDKLLGGPQAGIVSAAATSSIGSRRIR